MLAYTPYSDLVLRTQSSAEKLLTLVKQVSSFKLVPQVYYIRSIFVGINTYGWKHHTEQSGCQNTALLDPVGDSEFFGLISVVTDAHHHAII